MVTWADINLWSEGSMDDAEMALSAHRKTLSIGGEDLQSALKKVTSSSLMVDSALEQARKLGTNLDELIDIVGEALGAISEARDGVISVNSGVRGCHEWAQSQNMTINDSGIVTVASVRSSQLPSLNDTKRDSESWLNEQKRLEIQEEVDAVLKIAGEVSVQFCARLDRLSSGKFLQARRLMGSAGNSVFAGLLSVAEMIRLKTMTPTEAAAWWSSLTDSEKEQYIQHHPGLIGNMDGVDFISRDKANRLYIDQRIEQAEAECDASYAAYKNELNAARAAGIDPSKMPAIARYDEAKKALEELQTLKEQINVQGENEQPRFLLVLDPSGENLKAAVAYGNVDTAKNVSTFVPGMNTTVGSSIATYMDFTRALGKKAGDTATVAWLGYDAPGDLISVSNTHKAEVGAEKLSSFMEGMYSSREVVGAPRAHNSLIGHSYGSTTVGIASRNIPYGIVDEVVLLSSPGSGVNDVAEYNVSPGHVYTAAAGSHDIVPGIGEIAGMGTDPRVLEGVEGLKGGVEGAKYWQNVNVISGRHGSTLDPKSGIFKHIVTVVNGG